MRVVPEEARAVDRELVEEVAARRDHEEVMHGLPISHLVGCPAEPVRDRLEVTGHLGDDARLFEDLTDRRFVRNSVFIAER